jgi:hypothetical protein
MATSEADICNKALARIGVKSFIQNFEDQSDEAQVASLFYADERDSLLMQAPWPFATRRAALAEVDYTQEPLRDGWQKIYRCPNDMLEAWYIWPGGSTIPTITSVSAGGFPLESPLPLQGAWQNPRAPRSDQRVPFAIEAAQSSDDKVLLCDFAGAHLVYTSQIKDVGRFSALFTDALAWHLASVFAMPLAIKPEIAEMCERRAQAATELAIARHFAGEQEDLPPDSEMIMGRY